MRRKLAVLLGEGAIANGSPNLFDEIIELSLPRSTSELKIGNKRYILEPCRGLPDRGYEVDLFNEFSISNSGMQVFDLLSTIESVFTFNGELYVFDSSSRDKEDLRRKSELAKEKYLGVPKVAMGNSIRPPQRTPWGRVQ